MSRKIDVSVNNGLVTLCDEELDAVAAGATFTFNATANQLGNTNSVGNLTLNLTQGQTGQNVVFNGTFTTT
jgi:hypothetical protein